MNSEILNLINERDKAVTIANKNKGNKALRNHFNFLRNKVQREVRKAKSNYFKDRLEENKNNPKKLWKQCKTLGYSNENKERSKIVINIDDNVCLIPKKLLNT